MLHPTAGIGDNLPRHTAEAVAAMRDILATFTARRDEFLVKLRSTVILDRTDAGNATGRVGMAKEVGERLEEQRTAITDPLNDAVRATIATARNFWQPVDQEIARVTALIETFDTDQKAKAKAQADEQRATEETLRAAAQGNQPRPAIVYDRVAEPSAAPAPEGVEIAQPKAAEIRSDYGHTFRRRRKTTCTIADITLVPRDILESDPVTEAICKVAKARAAHVKTIPGIAIDRGTRGSVQ